MGLVKTAKQSNGAISRGFRIGKLAFSLVDSYLGYQAQNLLFGEKEQSQRRARFHQEASRWIREELGALKGPAMKLGQMLSLQDGMFSDETLDELAALQMQAPAMHPTLARAQFKSALGKYPEELFRQFTAEPFAAASLGQVHRAVTLKGEIVAVKIQYPAIRSAIESDFKLLKSATLPTRISGHVPAALVDEIQRGLLEETDYLREADNIEFFREKLAKLTYLTIPKVHRELSNDRVLTMSYVKGEVLREWLKRKPSRALRDLVGARLVEMFENQLQHLKVLHADQHPGNFLFQADGDIGLIDFGCVKRVSFDILERRKWYKKRVWRESEAAARRFLATIYNPTVPYRRARRILPLLEEWQDLLRPNGSGTDVIIGDRDPALEARWIEFRNRFRQRILRDKLFNPEFTFFVRADMGIRHLLRELGARVNVSEIIRRVAGSDSSALDSSALD
jgi:hypothetical protein